MWLSDTTGFGVTLVDTSTTEKDIPVFGLVFNVVNGVKEDISVILGASFYSRKIALKNAVNGFEVQSNFDGRAYAKVEIEELETRADLKKFLKQSYLLNGMFSIQGEGKIKIHKTNNLSISDMVWDSENENGYKPMDWNTFQNTILKNFHENLWVEFKYVPNSVSKVFIKYKHKEKNLQKEEQVVLAVGIDYRNTYNRLLGKISSLCNCKEGLAEEECQDEARLITDKYFEIYGKLANHDQSWGFVLLGVIVN